MDRIKNKWADITIVDPVNWALIFQFCTVIIVIVSFLFWHNRRLKSMVRAKTIELRQLNEGLESRVIERTKKLSEVNTELNRSLEEINILRGIIPICSSCKKVRDDKGYWNQIESYIQQHSDAKFSHGICDECSDKLYGHEKWYKAFRDKPKNNK